jgi:hypothetical protein
MPGDLVIGVDFGLRPCALVVCEFMFPLEDVRRLEAELAGIGVGDVEFEFMEPAK